MPIVDRDWWTLGKRPILKVGGNVTADVEQEDIASCAIAAAGIADGAVTSGKLGASAVTCAAISTGHIVSEKASANLVTRSYGAVIGAAVSSDGSYSSAYVLWRPLTPIQLQRVQVIPIKAYQQATADIITIFGNAGTSAGDINFAAVSTAIAAGTRTAWGNVNLQAFAACTDILAKYSASTCSVPPGFLVQLDYITTG